MDYEDDYIILPIKEKIVKIYKNGDPVMKPCDVKIQKNYNLQSIAQILDQKSEMKNFKCLRLFNNEGVEIFNDDIQYLKDKSVLYASNGEEFDANSTFSEYDLIKVIGEGGFGQVLLGIHKQTQEKVAIKIIKTSAIGNANDIDMVFREAEIVKSLNHKNIVKIKSCYTLSNMQVVFIMEYLEGGELLDRVEAKNNFEEQEARIYFKQIVEAMNYCHKNNLIHRDLKLENVLLTKPDQDQIKIVDFGIAGVASKFDVDNIDSGSLKYMSPEVVAAKIKQLTSAIDVWSMGVILYVMLVGDFPFNANSNIQVMDKILEGKFEIPKQIKKNTLKRMY
ncbi:protein kinase domain protein [Ichthyophthirius multifiliis]|uniref:Protein kinase domain protein n=1 Tax=Ichthyophthirius multifiliis TaxID=5932 RepID=G0R3L6_ICHMU|nr:protein kinase domain protein [Ichthyophthirius multifiliis]EGR27938.1 protein kinase domain protein [Ichthyophthirius multifiliis]|eukprot:XP_004027283.1 protein kinase domain protein [Ichthyophthirius multifiliis]